MKKLVISLLCLVSSSAMAQQWIALGGTSYNQYYAQENSLRISNNNETLTMTIQTVNRLNNKISYSNVVVSATSCRQQQGNVTSYTLDGKRSLNNIFALGGQDSPSRAATAICGTYHNYLISHPVKSVKEQASSDKIDIDSKTESNWHKIATNEKSEISFKINSFSLVKTKNGEEAIIVTGRNIDQKSKKITLVNWSVTKKDCSQQQGNLNTVNIDGKDGYDNNFAFGSGSLGSIISEAICNFKM